MKTRRVSRLILMLLAVTLFLTGCGGKTTDDEDRAAELPSASVKTAQEEADLPQTEEDALTSEPEESTPPVAEDPESEAPLSDGVVPQMEDVAGLWVLQEVEVDGDRVSAELAGLSNELLLREDGTADYIELTASGESIQHLNLIVDGDGDGRMNFSYDAEFGRCDCVITGVKGDVLELSTAWIGPDGTTGGSTLFFGRSEPDERGRRLYAAELEQLTDSLRYEENGFFVCTYDRPEEIDWHQVCYNGAGIGIEPDAEVRAAYEAACGEIETDLEAIYDSDLRNFVWEKTQTHYSEARRPLSLDWVYLDDLGLWFWQHGDTNAQSISFTDGYANGYEYYLYYTRDDYESFRSEREFVLHCYIRDGEWQYISNLPTDATAPVTLLNIDYFDTKEEAQARGVKAFVEVERQPWDEDYGWCWAVITAQTDNVRYIVDRSADPDYYELYGVFIPGDNITSGVLNDGESFAIYINQPWNPDVRLTAAKDEYWGEYAFGEDNWLGFDNSVRRYVTGHDLQGEGRGCYPEDEAQMSRFLADGSWVYLDEDTGEIMASVLFYGYNSLAITTADESYPIYVRFGYSEDWISGAPDRLALEKDDYNNIHDWSALPNRYTSDDLGDYAVFALQLDGEQIFYLTQANNGDGALSWLFPGADKNTRDFVLFRFRGTAMFEGQG